MKTLTSSKQIIWYDDELITHSVEQAFEPDFWHEQGKVIGSAQGRGTTWFVQTEQLPAALRHYRRGGLFGKLVEDHYFFHGWEQTRSYQEFCLLQHLVKSNVNVPKPIAARAYKRTICYQADILTQKVDHAKDLVDLLQKQTLDTSVYEAIGRQIRKLHEAEVNHTDLNIHNILVDKDNQVWIIDFDKCHLQNKHTNDEWKGANLQRLLRSFHKESVKKNILWNESKDWNALLIGYAAE